MHPEPGTGDERRVRLQKLLARAGIASRRHAEELIRAGRVAVNGAIVSELGTRADPGRDAVTIDGRPVSLPDQAVYLALNKPPGYVTTAGDPQGRPTVMDLVPPVAGLFPVGRLDAESEGLLLLTTDGEWAQRVSHPRYGCTKEYLVDVPARLTAAEVERLRHPMVLAQGERTTGALVEHMGDNVRADAGETRLRIVLHEGRNRQIRRMVERLGHRVRRLRRVRVGAVTLGTLGTGRWRHLTPTEVAATAGGAAGAPAARRRSA